MIDFTVALAVILIAYLCLWGITWLVGDPE